jgi:Flp pilus assembly protein TadB
MLTGRPDGGAAARSPRRWLSVLFVAIAAPGLLVFAAFADRAQAGVPKHPAWKSTFPVATWPNDGFTVRNNVLNPAEAGHQMIWANSYRHWGVVSTQPDTGSIKAYPSVQKNYPEHPEYSSLRYLRSSFKQSMPSAADLSAEAAYEVWLNNRTVEVMMWVSNHNQSPAGQVIGTIPIYQEKFVVWQDGNNKYSFVLDGQQATGRVHLLSALRWLVHHGPSSQARYLNRSDTLTEVDFGWEIASTGGKPLDFSVTGYAVSSGLKRAPKNEQPAGGLVLPHLPWALMLGLAAVFAALFLLAMLLLSKVARAGENRTLTSMFEKYGPRHQPAPAKNDTEANGTVTTAAVGAMTRLMSTGAQERLSRRLDLAGVKRVPAEWALLGACLVVAIGATLSVVTSYVLVGLLGGMLIGWLTMRLSLSVRILRRRASFSDQLPDMLQLIASTLKAGFSLPQALEAVVREENQPAAAEFSRVLAEARIGANLEDGLEAVATRMDSDDLRWTVMAIRIQQGVGGNLAEVLLTIADTIRERAFLRRQVRALSAEGRLSAYVLVALPLIVATWLFISSATYMRPLYTTPLGYLLLTIASALVLIGTYWMHRVIKVEI